MARLTSLMFALALSCGPISARAEVGGGVTLAEFTAAKGEQRSAYLFWLSGVEAGIQVANVRLKLAGQAMLYCQPNKLGLTIDQVEDIMNRYVRAHPTAATPDLPVSLAMMFALQEAFPCPSS